MSEGFKFCLWGIIVFKWVQMCLRGSNFLRNLIFKVLDKTFALILHIFGSF